MREFARKNNLILSEINLERHLALDELFQTTSVTAICRELEAITGKGIQDPGTLLFFDKIQASPHALMLLRYLHEEMPEVPIINYRNCNGNSFL